MRYLDVPTINFTDANGVTREVKDIRAIPEYRTQFVFPNKEGIELDEFVSRPTIYGEGNEDLLYTFVDANKIKMVENNFRFDRLKEFVVPVVEDR